MMKYLYITTKYAVLKLTLKPEFDPEPKLDLTDFDKRSF